MAIDVELARSVAECIQKKRDLEEQLRSTKEELSRLEPLMLAEMRDNQLGSMTLQVGRGMVTLHTRETLIARPRAGLGRQDVIDALSELGLGLVQNNYNANTLNAYVREVLASGDELPAELMAVLDIDTLTSIRARNSNSVDSLTSKARRNLETSDD